MIRMPLHEGPNSKSILRMCGLNWLGAGFHRRLIAANFLKGHHWRGLQAFELCAPVKFANPSKLISAFLREVLPFRLCVGEKSYPNLE